MNIPASRLMAVAAATVVALLALRGGSFVPMHNAAGDSAWVRLSWSARPERVEQCRLLSDAELAERPAHMRLRLECEGRFARYVLQLTVDDQVVLTDTIQGGGLRHDRPMHVLHEASLAPGTRRLHAQLVRLDSVATVATGADRAPGAGRDSVLGEREGREREERVRREGESIPPYLALDTTVTLRAGRVLLLTYDDTRRTLAARTGGG